MADLALAARCAVASSLALALGAQLAAQIAARPGEPLRMPPQFVENKGQWSQPARFLCAQGAQRTWVVDDGLVVAAERGDLGVALHLHFADAAIAARGVTVVPTRRHWLRSPADGGPVTDVRAYERVALPAVRAGIDVALRTADGVVEYDLVCTDGAHLEDLEVVVDGHDDLRLLADGSLALSTPLGDFVQTAPRTFVTAPDGSRRSLASRFVVRGRDRFGFAVDGWHGGTLTIDPGLIWGSFLGGSGLDRCSGVSVDSTGAACVAGTTNSTNLPTTPGVFHPALSAGIDAFVAKLSVDGSGLQFCSYVGGVSDETMTSLQVLGDDRIAIAGVTTSTNFPITGNRYQGTRSGPSDAYVAILTPTGNALDYGTYFGSTSDETDTRMAIVSSGDIWLAGRTIGSILTTANAYQFANASPGLGDAYLAVLNRSIISSTTLGFGTHFGGSADERSVDSLSVTTGPQGQLLATIGLTTDSTSMPTAGTPYQAAPVGNLPTGFFVQLDPSQAVPASVLAYGSYFGAAGGTTTGVLAQRDSAGLYGFAATTSSTTWATTGIAYQRTYGGGTSDVIMGRFDPSRGAGALVLASYLGGNGTDTALAMSHVYTSGLVDLATVVGSTTSTNFPVSTSALQTAVNGGGLSGFIGQLDYRSFLANMLRYGSYFDGVGVGDDALRAVHRAASGELTVAGESQALLTPGRVPAVQPLPNGGVEGTVARLDLVAQTPAFTAYGTGCGSPGQIPVLAAGLPARIGQNFNVTLSNMLPGGGFMVLGFSDQLWAGLIPLPRELSVLGMPNCFQYTDIYDYYLHVYGGTSTTWGMPVPLAMDFYGIDFYLQFLMADPSANALGLASTNAGHLNVRY